MALQMVRNAVRAGRHARRLLLRARRADPRPAPHLARGGHGGRRGRASTPPPRADVHAVRAVFEAGRPRPARARRGAGAHPLRRRRPRRRAGVRRPPARPRVQPARPPRRGGRGAVSRARRGRASPRWCSSTTSRRCPSRPRRRRGLPGHGRHRDPQGHGPRARVPGRVHLRGRPREPGCRPPHAHPRPARLLGAGLRGRPRAHPVEQGEHRLARAPRLRPRQHAGASAAGPSSPSRRTGTAWARSSSRCRRTSSTAASTPQAQVVTERLIEERIFTT